MLTNCPACGAPLNIEGSTTRTVCPFCGNNFKVDMGGVQPALEKTDAVAVEYEPPSVEPLQIDTDPLYNPPIESSAPESTYTPPAPAHIPFPQQTYESVRNTAQGMYGTLAAKGKNFLALGLLLLLALVGGCCACLVLSIRQISIWLGGG